MNVTGTIHTWNMALNRTLLSQAPDVYLDIMVVSRIGLYRIGIND